MTQKEKMGFGLAILILLAAILSGVYFYNKYQATQKELQTVKTNPSSVQKAAQEETQQLVSEIGKLIELPSGEQPTVATVTDIGKLKDQPFFQSAKNGDKVLIYTNAKKAILYDPIQHKVIDVAPVNIGSSSAQIASPYAKIDIRNGTPTPGLTTKIEAELKKVVNDASVAGKDNSPKTDYDKTIVVTLNDQFKDFANNIAQAINVKVGDLPKGESKPAGADIMIIIGKDKIPTSSPTPKSS